MNYALDELLKRPALLNLLLNEVERAKATREEKIEIFLRRLSKEEKNDASIELRKWRWCLLSNLLDDLDDDPADGLVRLSEFWNMFGNPNDSPHRKIGDTCPTDYFTEENYRTTTEAHLNWLDTEEAALRRASFEK